MKFDEMKLDKKVLDGVIALGYKTPTGIQEKCIPQILAGKDVVGQSLTGSGKTAAFGLPLLMKVIPGEGIQALILTPTRELCVQVRDSIEAMGRFVPLNIKAIYGGVGYYQQREDIQIAEVLVATPGRLLDHLNQGNLKLGKVKYMVLDEADRMLDMGFERDVTKILSHVPKQRQTVMFSATMPKQIVHLIHKHMNNPQFVEEQLHVDRSLLKQGYYIVEKPEKSKLLAYLLKNKTSGNAIVFCRTKVETDRVARILRKNNIDVVAIHGDIPQGKRERSLKLFRDGKIDALIATDVAARGLDIQDISHVYNYTIPMSAEDYTHRIGRTARAGKGGDAVSFISRMDFRTFDQIIREGKLEVTELSKPDQETLSKDFSEAPMEHHDRGSHSRGSQEYHATHDRHPRAHSHYQSRDRGYGHSGSGSAPSYGGGQGSSEGSGASPQYSQPRSQGYNSRPHQSRGNYGSEGSSSASGSGNSGYRGGYGGGQRRSGSGYGHRSSGGGGYGSSGAGQSRGYSQRPSHSYGQQSSSSGEGSSSGSSGATQGSSHSGEHSQSSYGPRHSGPRRNNGPRRRY